MNLKGLTLLLSVGLLLGCKDYNGHLEVYENISVKPKRGDSLLRSGEYTVELKVKSSKKSVLEIKNASTDGDDIKLEFKYNKNTIPKYNGTFKILAKESGQPFDVLGELKSQTHERGPYRRTESCSYTRYETICWPTPRGTVCRSEPRHYQGWEDIEYYDSVTEQNLSLELKDSMDKRRLGLMNGRDTERTERVVYRSGCRW